MFKSYTRLDYVPSDLLRDAINHFYPQVKDERMMEYILQNLEEYRRNISLKDAVLSISIPIIADDYIRFHNEYLGCSRIPQAELDQKSPKEFAKIALDGRVWWSYYRRGGAIMTPFGGIMSSNV